LLVQSALINLQSLQLVLWKRNTVAATVVVAASGYPDAPRKGDVITIPAVPRDDVVVFHAGTAVKSDNKLTSSGGRILACTGIAPSLKVWHTRLSTEDGESVFICLYRPP
jgi:phosphoribosylamine-glycine ligase